MVSFIDTHREAYGVKSICAELPIAASTYHESKAREPDRAPLPTRPQPDTLLLGDRTGVEESVGVSGCTGCGSAQPGGPYGGPMHGDAIDGRDGASWRGLESVVEDDDESKLTHTAPGPAESGVRGEPTQCVVGGGPDLCDGWRGFVYVAMDLPGLGGQVG